MGRTTSQIAADAREPYARQIAELVRALKTVEQWASSDVSGGDNVSPDVLAERLQFVRSAIAKAEGR